MIEAFKKIWKFSGNEKKNINKSVAVGFLNAVLQMFQVAAIYFRRANVDVTNILTPYTALEEGILQVASVAMMLTAILLCIGGKMMLPNALMTVVMSFLVFNQIKAFGMGVSMIRLTAAAIDRTVETEICRAWTKTERQFLPQSTTSYLTT